MNPPMLTGGESRIVRDRQKLTGLYHYNSFTSVCTRIHSSRPAGNLPGPGGVDLRTQNLPPGQLLTGDIRRAVKRFRGGLVFKAHRLVDHSTLGLRAIKKKKKIHSPGQGLHTGTITNRCSLMPVIDSGLVGSTVLYRDDHYRGSSLIRNRHPVGPYSRTMPRLLWRSWGWGAVSYERGSPVSLAGFIPDAL